MKATIVEISSGSAWTDGEMRVMLRIDGADKVYNKVQFPVSKLGLNGAGAGPHLDQEVEVTLSIVKGKK